MRRLGLAAALLLMVVPAQAQPLPTPPPDQWQGWGFSVALTFWDNLSGADLLTGETDAQTDEDGVLYLSRVENVGTGITFEAHHTFRLSDSLGLGPFFNVVPGEEELIRGAGAGGTIEMRRADGTVGMTVFVGVLVLFNTLQLDDAFVVGQPVPSLPIRFVRKEEAALQIGLGVSF